MTAAAAQQEAARRGLLLLTCGAWGQVVRFIPALVVNSDQVDEAAGIWADAVDAVIVLSLNSIQRTLAAQSHLVPPAGPILDLFAVSVPVAR